jgi:cell wall-associated NlpC family hydrolase
MTISREQYSPATEELFLLRGLRASIVAEAMEWLHTPYHHQAALKKVGCDCVGLLIGVARALGLIDASWQTPVYSPEAHFYQKHERLREVILSAGGREIPLAQRQPGDILLFHYGQAAGHAGILLPTPVWLASARRSDRHVSLDYIIHASQTDGRVVHHRLAGDLEERQRFAFAFPKVEL